MRNLLVVALVGLVVYTIIDVARSDPDERFGLSKVLWIALIVILPVAGSVAWLVARQRARSGGAGGTGGGGGGSRPGPSRPGPRRPSGPVAPDDDPEFLWRLDQMQRRAQREREGGGSDGAPGAGPTDAEGDSPGHETPGPRTNH
jgi:Phospholipase_D-nuclease N-terminal